MKGLSTKEEISKKEIEVVHKKFIKEYGLKKKFIQVILSNFEEWKTDFSEKEFKDLLSSIYNIRSMFTHKGENLKKYVELVDTQLKSKSVFIKIRDKNVEFPGLKYLSMLVRTVLISFLEKQEASNCDNIPKLALKEGIVNLIANEPIQGSFVTKNQIRYRK